MYVIQKNTSPVPLVYAYKNYLEHFNSIKTVMTMKYDNKQYNMHINKRKSFHIYQLKI